MIQKTLQKYLGLFPNIIDYITSTGVEFSEEPCNFLPGYSKVCWLPKPHHTDPVKRHLEEEFFFLHDLLHQLFPVNIALPKDKFVESQVNGEFFVFCLTEFFFQRYGNPTTETKLFLEQRGYYNKLSKHYNGSLFDLAKSLASGVVLPEITKMFEEDKTNSANNYDLLPPMENVGEGCPVTIEEYYEEFVKKFKGEGVIYKNNNVSINVPGWV